MRPCGLSLALPWQHFALRESLGVPHVMHGVGWVGGACEIGRSVHAGWQMIYEQLAGSVLG